MLHQLQERVAAVRPACAAYHLFGCHPLSPGPVQVWHPLFVAHSVDFVLTAHQHFYERLCAVESEHACSADRDRPLYIVDGSAGAESDPHETPSSPLTRYKDFDQWGYSRLEVTPGALTWKHYHTDNAVWDEVSLPARAP
jgi:hypothetical protein